MKELEKLLEGFDEYTKGMIRHYYQIGLDRKIRKLTVATVGDNNHLLSSITSANIAGACYEDNNNHLLSSITSANLAGVCDEDNNKQPSSITSANLAGVRDEEDNNNLLRALNVFRANPEMARGVNLLNIVDKAKVNRPISILNAVAYLGRDIEDNDSNIASAITNSQEEDI